MTKDEMKAVLALLEDEYASPEEAARTVFDGVTELIMRRDSYGVGLSGIAWGPFFGLVDAKRAAKDIGGGVARLYSAQNLLVKLDTPIGDLRYCPDCEHPKIAHSERPWKEVGAEWFRNPGCCALKCQCPRVFPVTRKTR